MWHLRKRSISKELVISLFLLVVLIEGALFGYFYITQSRTMLRKLDEKSDDDIARLSEILAVPMWDYDDEQIQRIGAHFVQNVLVSELHITDLQNRSLFDYADPNSSQGRIRRSGDIAYRGQKIGQVALSLSLDAYQQELVWVRKGYLLMLIGSLGVIFIATGILLRFLLRVPLSSLQKGIDRVAAGDYSYRFDDIRHSELDGIAKRFSEMAQKVQARENTLYQTNQALEAEIAVRGKIEDRIRDSEARSHALLDAIPDLILRLDKQGTILDFRGKKEDFILAAEDFTGKNIDTIAPPDIADLFKTNVTRALKTGTIQFFEYELIQDRHAAYFECRVSVVNETVALSIIRNITKNREDAAEKSRLAEQLRQAQKMEAVGTLAGGVAHDLNNILSGIVSYPELLLLDMAEDHPMHKPLSVIKASGEKAATIVQDLLTLARRGVTVTEVVNLNRILEQYLSSPEWRKLKTYHPDIRMVTRLESRLLNISGSPVHLSKTLMNLIGNAAEAMADGGTIVVSTRNQYIDLPIRGYDDVAEGDYAVLTVSDTGVGISAADMKRIFEPFYTKKVMGRSGTGLGMAVVWGTVKDHNGYIDVQSTKDRGTTITLYIPATRKTLSERDAPVSTADYMGSGQTILVVDDVQDQRDIASSMLRKLNYTVSTVDSGEQALAYLKVHSVDLLVLDMIMEPGIDGLETYRGILQLHPGQKAIIASGFSETERVRSAQKLGAGPYLRKPYTLEQIGLAVKRELSGPKS